MKNNTRKFDPESYRGTYEYYVKYRPSIPEKVIDVIIEHFDIKPTDRILDIGCGTGQVALSMDGKCAEMVCLDPDPKMLEWAKRATKGSKTKLVWLNCAAEDLEGMKKKIGTFKVATSSRAFHRMNENQTLKHLDELIKKDGGVVVFSDRVLWGGNENWQQAVKSVIRKYLEEKTQVGKEKPIEPDDLWENVLARSRFRFVKIYDLPVVREWDVESIIGYVLSTSAAAPYLFGNQLDEFKEEIKNILLSTNPKGVFQENAVWHMVLGSRKPPRN